MSYELYRDYIKLKWMIESVLPEVLFAISTISFIITLAIVIPGLVSNRRRRKVLSNSYNELGKRNTK